MFHVVVLFCDLPELGLGHRLKGCISSYRRNLAGAFLKSESLYSTSSRPSRELNLNSGGNSWQNDFAIRKPTTRVAQ